MGLGDILGSLSPVFGLASGKGFFGNLPQQLMGGGGLLGGGGSSGGFGGLGGLIEMMLSQGNSQPSSPAPLPGTSIPTPQVASSLPGPGIGQFAASMPQLGSSSGGPLGALGSAFKSGQKQDPGVGPMQAPGLVPAHGSGLLQAILGDGGQAMEPMGLSAILQRLGAIR